MGISKTMAADIQGDITLVTIRVLSDFSDEPGYHPVEPGTNVQAYLPKPDEVTHIEGEAWYIHPTSGADWLSLPGDFEVIE